MKTSQSPPPRLTPPPRIGSSPRAKHQLPKAGALRPSPRGGHGAKWLTGLLFAVLALLAGAVFLVLPDWVRQQQEVAQASAADPAAEASAMRSQLQDDAAEAAPESSPSTLAEEPEVNLSPNEPAADPSPIEQPGREEPALRDPATAPRTERRAKTGESQQPPPQPTDRAAFEQAMSEGLAALDRDDFTTARDAFRRAGSLEPGSPHSADGLLRAATGLRVATITRLHEQATAAAEAEDWHRATSLFAQALELDPAVEFARQGHAESLERAQLADSLDFHIKNPQRLSAEPVLHEATAVLGQARDIQPSGALLQRQIAALALHVEAFSTPVSATLTSDNLTEVQVYKVGSLGTFSHHSLELRPGTYTVVGSRQGYRDVRRRLTIAPGVEPQPLAIRCEEKI